jgi:hypothetical protein
MIGGGLLAALALLDGGGATTPAAADGSTGCRMEVAAEELNVRTEPTTESALVAALPRGAVVDATLVVTDGFRELEDGRWAADQFLVPVPGSTCA